jgi:D-glycero-alpha-D-manno-heptose-7-phosphate kinase
MSRMPRVEASAPSRIDLAGGTLDIWPISVLVPGALTVNLAIELRATATIEPLRERRIVVVSRDRKRTAARELPLAPADAAGPLALLLRLAASFAPAGGLRLVTEAQAPAGAGLGGSSTLGIAAGSALNRWTRAGLDRQALLARVLNLETLQIGAPTGNQDYLAAIHGGLSAYHHGPDGTRREALRLPPGLERRLVLAYTGQPRSSGSSNWDMFRRFIEGERTTVARMHTIARIAAELRDALGEGDLDAAGRLVGEEGRLRYRLAPSVATAALLAADRAARRAGALGVKVCGAGGGGCLVAFAREGRRDAVAEAVAGTGARVLEARVARRGVRVAVSENGASGRRRGS